MRLIEFARARELLAAAEQWLAAAARETNLVITALAAAAPAENTGRGWLVMSSGAPQLALFQTPSQYLLLSGGNPEAAAWAAASMEAELPGINGPAAVALAFSARWSERTGRTAAVNGEMTFFTAERIEVFRRPRGMLRLARAEEIDLLEPLALAAARDMKLPRPEQDPLVVQKALRRAIAEDRQFVWADGASIRAMASYVTALRGGGARIRGVYTPPELRGGGYGTAVSGALAEWLLGSSQSWVSLFADNANPVSTRIYRRLGFQPGPVHQSVRFE